MSNTTKEVVFEMPTSHRLIWTILVNKMQRSFILLKQLSLSRSFKINIYIYIGKYIDQSTESTEMAIAPN